MSDRLVITWNREHSTINREHRRADLDVCPDEMVLRAFLGEKFARHAEQQSGEAEGAAGNDSGIHTPNVLRASGARKSAP